MPESEADKDLFHLGKRFSPKFHCKCASREKIELVRDKSNFGYTAIVEVIRDKGGNIIDACVV